MVQSQLSALLTASPRRLGFQFAMIGGETFSRGFLEKLSSFAITLFAVYGPTETVMYASSYETDIERGFEAYQSDPSRSRPYPKALGY